MAGCCEISVEAGAECVSGEGCFCVQDRYIDQMFEKSDGEDRSGAGILKKLRECLNLPWIDC